MHGGYHDDNEGQKKDAVDTASIREKVKLARSEKWRILKNIIVVSLAFMIQFTAFQVSNLHKFRKKAMCTWESNNFLRLIQGTANLQSSINSKDSLGTISLSAIYGALVISCIFLPTLLIRKLTVKWALFFSMLCYAPYIAAQFYPRFFTLIPVSVTCTFLFITTCQINSW